MAPLPMRALRPAPVAVRPLVAAPSVASKVQKHHALHVVRAAEEDIIGDTSDDDVPVELEVDEVQEKRARRENQYQARQNSGQNSDRRQKNADDDWEDKIIELNRVTKVLKGGKLMKFRATVVSGNRKGQVGCGVASAREVVDAVERASTIAKASAIKAPITAGRTFPHKLQIKEGAARIMLRPASEGTGVIAGGAVRIVLELAGYQNAFGKIYGTNSAMNNARGTIAALSQMFTWKKVAADRGITVDYAMGRTSEPNEVVGRN